MHHEATTHRDALAVQRANFLLSLQLEQATTAPTPWQSPRTADAWTDSAYGEPITPDQAAQHAAVLVRESVEFDRAHRGDDRMHLRAVS